MSEPVVPEPQTTGQRGATEEQDATEPVGSAPPASGLAIDGVVDAIRVPEWVERRYREMPQLARIFIGLAVIDVLGRLIGIIPPRLELNLERPLDLLGQVVPHDLWILLPAVLVLRRRDVETATPWILWGAIVVALVNLVSDPIRTWLSPTPAIGLWLSILVGAFLVAGWLLLARGLSFLNPAQPSEFAVGLSNAVAISVAIMIVIGLAQGLINPPYVGDSGLDQLLAISSLAGSVGLAGWGYLLWATTRGVEDERRRQSALVTSTMGAVVTATVGALTSFLGFFLVLSHAGPDSVIQDVVNILGWLVYVLGPTLVVAGFYLGLAEPPVPVLTGQPAGEPDSGATTQPSST